MRGIFMLLCCLAFIKADAQRTCLTDSRSYTYVAIDNGTSSRDTLRDEVITIPVVIHVLYNNNHQNISDAQIRSQIDVLNEDFRMMNANGASVPSAFRNKMADTRIQFCLARVDPQGRATNGIIRTYTSVNPFVTADAMKFKAAGGADAWDNSRYLNIWVCSMFGRSLGYATMPGGPKDKDGVVINFDVFGRTGTLRAPYNKGRTATHEVAHWMGLKHIWGDDLCGNDEVDDTPPQKSYNYYCPTFPKMSSCSPDYSGDMFMNFMDLTDDACMSMFTHGQKQRMRSVFSFYGPRNSFLASNVCDSTTATGGPLPPTVPPPAAEIPVIPVADINIFPNPVSNKLTLSPVNDIDISGTGYAIYTAQGNIVMQNVLRNNGSTELNLSALAPGVYFLTLNKDSFKKRYKIIKI